METFRTARLRFRELTDADHEALFAMYQDPRMNRFIGGPPPGAEEYWRRVRETWPAYYRTHGFGLWATERLDDERLIGRCGLLAQDVAGERRTEVAYALAPEFWGRGYATEAARGIRDRAFRETAVPELISLILPENTASIAVAERNGMRLWMATEFRGHADVRVYRITRAEWERREGV